MLNLRRFFWPLLLLLLLRSGWELTRYNWKITDNDQSLYWLAAHELSSGTLPPVFVYGQDYNYFVEPWLATPLVVCGLPPVYALPLATALMALAPFLAFAFSARRRKQEGAALLWLAMPLLLPSAWYILSGMPRGFVNGLFLFTAFPAVLRLNREGLRWLLIGLLFAAALAINPNTLPLVLCCGILLAAPALRKWRFYVCIVSGALPILLLHVWLTQQAQHEPQGLLHPQWGLEWTVDYFTNGISHAGQWLYALLPGNAGWWLLLPLLVVLGWLAIYQQKRSVLVALISTVIVLLLTLGINKLHDGREHLHYAFSRMWLALPLIIGVLAERLRVRTPLALPAFGILLLIAVFGFGVPASQTVRDLPLRIQFIDKLKQQSNSLQQLLRSERPTAVVGLGYPVWVGDQQLLFHYSEIAMKTPPRFVIPGYERRRKLLALPLRGKLLLLGGEEQQWKTYGYGLKPVAISGMSGAVVEH